MIERLSFSPSIRQLSALYLGLAALSAPAVHAAQFNQYVNALGNAASNPAGTTLAPADVLSNFTNFGVYNNSGYTYTIGFVDNFGFQNNATPGPSGIGQGVFNNLGAGSYLAMTHGSNSGVLNNQGLLGLNWVLDPATNTHGSGNSSFALFTNNGLVTNDGSVVNAGYVTNNGTIANDAGASFNSAYNDTQTLVGLPSNFYAIQISNNGIFTNAGALTNGSAADAALGAHSSTIINKGTFQNDGGSTPGPQNGNVQNWDTVNNYTTVSNVRGAQFDNRGVFSNLDTAPIGATLLIDAASSFNNYGTLNNSLLSSVTSNGSFTNAASGTLNNNGLITVAGGTFTNTAGAAFNNETTGQFTVSGGTLHNAVGASVFNDGQLTVGASGVLQDDGLIAVSKNATLSNNNQFNISGTAGVQLDGTFSNVAALNNDGTIAIDTTGHMVHSGDLENRADGYLANDGLLELTAPAVVNNFGGIVNAGTFTTAQGSSINNNAAVTNSAGGVLTHAGTLNNNAFATVTNAASATLNVAATGVINNNDNATFTNAVGGTVNHAGTLTNSSMGTVLNDGVLNVTTTGTINNNGLLYNRATGVATVDGIINNQGTVQNDNQLTVTANGLITGTGNYTQNIGLTTVDGTLTQANTYIQGGKLGGGGTINGDVYLEAGTLGLPAGSINGNVYQTGGVLAPGDPALMTINGNLQFIGGTLDIKVAGAGNLDQVLVTGLTSITGGTLELDFIDGFVPHTGDAFYFLLNNDLSALNFNNVTYTGLQPGFQFDLASDGTGIELQTLSDGTTPVPVPASVWMLGLGLTLLGGMAGRGSGRRQIAAA